MRFSLFYLLLLIPILSMAQQNSKSVKNFNDLMSAIHNREKEINIARNIMCFNSFTLPEGVTLKGIAQENGEYPMLSFDGVDGIGVTANNIIENLNINTNPERKAVFLANNQPQLGQFSFKNMTIAGQFSFLTRKGVKSANVKVDGLDIVAANTKSHPEHPYKYGAHAFQGAFTVYNFSTDKDSNINLSVNNLSIGRKHAPVIGTGVFVAGFGDEGGKVTADKIHTNAVYTNGKLPFGIANIITAAVFILNGAHAKEVVHDGEIATYGVNDMVLDTWGTVDHWLINQPIMSYGPSGVGFVNFGTVKKFEMNAPLKTFGLGARGYNQYDGTVDDIRFKSIETYGDGSVGVQISKKIGKLSIDEGIITHGGKGNTLVKGVNVELSAYALSIKNGGDVDEINIGGNIETHGDEVVTYITEKGAKVNRLNVKGKIIATGKNSIAEKKNVEE